MSLFGWMKKSLPAAMPDFEDLHLGPFPWIGARGIVPREFITTMKSAIPGPLITGYLNVSPGAVAVDYVGMAQQPNVVLFPDPQIGDAGLYQGAINNETLS